MGENCGEMGQRRWCSSNGVLFPVLTMLTLRFTCCDNETAFKKSGGFEMVIVEVCVICFQLFKPLGLNQVLNIGLNINIYCILGSSWCSQPSLPLPFPTMSVFCM